MNAANEIYELQTTTHTSFPKVTDSYGLMVMENASPINNFLRELLRLGIANYQGVLGD
jgi:hypothetical protein